MDDSTFQRSDAATAPPQPAPAEIIRTLPAFSALSRDTISRLLGLISVEQIPARTTLVQEGTPQQSLYIVMEGLLQLCTGSGVQQPTLAIIEAPALAFPDAIVRDATPLASARTLLPSRIGRLPVDQARLLFETEREFADAIVTDLARNWWRTLREYKNARTRSGLLRLVAWIVAMQRRAANPCEVRLPFDKSVLAARLGVAAATLSRDLARLVPLGVTVRGRTLEISDAGRLRAMLGDDAANAAPVP
jgi:CRP/FNR family transcriptional activator FtrB